jgi:2-methylisocitrate lyase-like PEP mutase family enzyme
MLTWHQTVIKNKPLILPVAHNALTAKLIEQAGFPAYQIGGFALIGANLALPDIDLVHYGEEAFFIEKILATSKVPVLVDCDNGHGDLPVTIRTLVGYERLGASALFIEDQASPKKCGHMSNKHIVPCSKMCDKIKRGKDNLHKKTTYLIARTDAYGSEGCDAAIDRGIEYLKAGASALYFEGVSDPKDLEKIGKEFKHNGLATSILENGGKTPWIPVDELAGMGYSMILYPTTILFRVVKSIRTGLRDLKNGWELGENGVDFDEFEGIIETEKWKRLTDE